MYGDNENDALGRVSFDVLRGGTQPINESWPLTDAAAHVWNL